MPRGIRGDIEGAGSEYVQQDLCTPLQAASRQVTKLHSGVPRNGLHPTEGPTTEHVEGWVEPTPVGS